MTDPFSASSPLIVLFLLAGAALGILVTEHGRVPWRVSAWVALAALVVAPALSAIVVLSGQGGTLHGMLSLEGPASVRIFMASSAAAGIVLLDLSGRRQMRSARYALILFSVCGIVTVAQSRHLIPLVLGIAILHVALAALIGVDVGEANSVLSAVGLASVLLAGALLYGATGNLRLDLIQEQLAEQALGELRDPLLVLGLALLLAGLGLCLGIVPFHTWIHAVFAQAHPHEGYVIAALSPQLALAVLAALPEAWTAGATSLALLIASASIPYGYARALRASTWPEALAGVATGQAGLLLGHAFVAARGEQPITYYALGNYLLNAMCLWAVSGQLAQPADDSRRGPAFDGVARRTPWVGAALTVCLLNIAGLYPLSGALTQIAFLRASVSAGHIGVSILIVLGAAFAWLAAGKLSLRAWAACDEQPAQAAPSPELMVVVWGATAAMVVSGLYAAGVWRWISALVGGL